MGVKTLLTFVLSTIRNPASRDWNMYAGGQARGARLMGITAECDGE